MESPAHVFRFGPYESRPQSRELYKHGLKIKVRPQQVQVLNLLLSRAGEAVSREIMREHLWPAETFVDFEHSLNTAIKEIRVVLGDSAVAPRYIETLPRLGYRFIAPVEVSETPPSPIHSQSPSAILVVDDGVRRTPKNPYLWFAAALVVAAATIAGISYHRRARFQITPRDPIVLADFTNSTGEPVFNDALKQGLNVGLAQSPVVRILSDEKTTTVLKQMGLPADQPITGRAAIELCQRAGGNITVQGTISKLGTAYVIGLAAIRCDNGEHIADEQEVAKKQEDVVETLGKATSQLRSRLGESLPSIKTYNAPLEEATTPSLEALKAYGAAIAKSEQESYLAAVPLFDRAINLDPNFALAYGQLATLYWNSDETDLARQNASRAYELRNRTTGLEKLSIESWYSIYVTGDLEKAVATLEIMRQTYPGVSTSLNDLGTLYGTLGQYDKAVERFHESLQAEPLSAATAGNLAVSLMALGRNDEARAVLKEASKLGPPTETLFQANYWIAFLRRDTEEIDQIRSIAPAVAGARAILLSTQANTEAYSGHFEKGRQLTDDAANQMLADGQKAAAGLCYAQFAVWEAEVADFARARELMAKALKLSHEQNVIVLSAVVAALSGDTSKANSIADQLSREHPLDTFIQKYWLPLIRAQIEMHQGEPSRAVDTLNAVLPLEAAAPEALDVCALFPAYARGQSYSAATEGDKAALQFQKIIDNPGMILNCPVGPLAWLGVARAQRIAKQETPANQNYEAFFTLWKDADTDLPILTQAKSEYEKLDRP